jgi:hypothetical protein
VTPNPYPGDNEGELQDLSIQLNVPDEVNNPTQLRSIGIDQEKAIKTVDVLAFRVESDGEKFDYYAKSSMENSNTVNIIAWTGSYQQRFVVITNAHEQVQALFDSEVSWKGWEKGAMLDSLEFTLSAGNQWKAIDANNYMAFPMWGESGAATVTKLTKQLEGKVSLLRMVAKINVELTGINATSKSELIKKFKLNSVRLYNTNTKGRIVPNSAKAVNIPKDSEKYLGPVEYLNTSAVSVKDSIYLFETAAVDFVGKFENSSEATCLVIGGYYYDPTNVKNPGNPNVQTYYRVDFLNEAKTANLNILRNHRYEVNITDVLGIGYDTPEEAFAAKAVNMEVDILDWKDGGMDNVVLDGQFFLSVSQDEFNFSKEERTAGDSDNILIVETDYTTTVPGHSGWYIEKIVDADDETTVVDWLTVTPDHGDTVSPLRLIFGENPGSTTRSAKIIFAAGRLRYPVIVRQTTLSRVKIELFMSKLIGTNQYALDESNPINQSEFIFSNNSAQHIFVRWEPSDENLVLYQTVIPGINYQNFHIPASGVIIGALPNSNPLMIVITPPQSTNPPYEGSSKLVFTVTNSVNTLQRELILKRVQDINP